MTRHFWMTLSLLPSLALAACAAGPAARVPSPTAAALVQAAMLTPTLLPTRTHTAPPPTQTPIPAPRLCTPLQNLPLSQMSTLVSNAYYPPPPGTDDPHAGVDLAVRLGDTQMAMPGHPVQAALAGQVAMILRDRFPFGNAILIETPLDTYPTDWWQPAEIPEPAPTMPPRSALTCPAAPAPTFPDANRRSLYVLYAHLQQPSSFNPGDKAACGQVIGAIGSTGNALNPHLHFETRVGPAGLRLDSMAHYHSSATPAEMSNYCLWTVSGLFQLVDPLKVLSLKQNPSETVR